MVTVSLICEIEVILSTAFWELSSMTVAGPWSVKGIDPKAKELAKDLARRSGMTLGEWLNQMIIEGGGEAEAPPLEQSLRETVRDVFPRAPPERRRLLDDLYNDATRRPVERAPRAYEPPSRSVGRDVGREPAAYAEPPRRADAAELPNINHALEALSARIEAAEHRSTLAISGIDQSVMGVLSRLDDLDREQSTVASRFHGAVDDVRETQAKVIERLRHMENADSSRVEAMKALELALGRLATHLNDGSADADAANNEARRELESLARRINRVEAAADGGSEIRADLERARSELDALTRRLSKVEASAESLPNVYAFAGPTLEALDGLVRRVSRVEAAADAAPETFAEAGRTQDALDMLGRRLGRVEKVADAAPSAYADAEKVETVLMHMAERLERAEARTSSAVQSLETSFAGLDARIRATETRLGRDGQVSAEFDRRFQSLAAELSQQVEASRAELAQKLSTVGDGRLDGIETQLRDLAGHLDQSEKRSAQAIDRMGREVVTIAQSLGERVNQTEARTTAAVEHMGGEMTRIADAMEGRLQRADTAQAQALEKLGGEIARIAERLTERLSHSDRRSAAAMDEVTDKVGRLSESLTRQQNAQSAELSDRIRQSEERTAKLLDEARTRFAESLSDAQRRPDPAPMAYQPPSSASAYASQASKTYDAPNLNPSANADPFDLPDSMFEPAHSPTADLSPVAAPIEARRQPPIVSADAFAEPNDYEDSDFSAFDAADDFQTFTPEHAAQVERHIEHNGAFVDEPPIEPAIASAPTRFEDEFHSDFDAPEATEAEPYTEDLQPETPKPLGFSVRDFQPATLDASPPSSTREMIDAARAAARRAAGGRDQSRPGSVPVPPLEPLSPSANKAFGMTFLGRKRKESGGPTFRTMILASGWAAAITAATVGAYHISHDGVGGHAVARPQLAGIPKAPTAMPQAQTGAPDLAVALAPSLGAGVPVDSSATAKPKADEPVSEPSATTLQTSRSLYDSAVQQIEAGDLSGVASLRRAANLGYGPAQFYLGRLYESGGGGVRKDLAEARRWTERAAQSGEATAMYNLASYLYAGEGGIKDPTAAANWFHRAADRGVVNSQFNLAQLYEKGYGVPLNPAEAYKWYLVAAAAGDAEAKADAEALRRRLPPEAQSAAERSAAILHAQSVSATRSAAAAMQPALPAGQTSAQSSIQVAARADH
jgi:localization factor PodJL